MIGTILANRYEILELIGTGGMANVYKARCMLLNRDVAIKVLKSEFSNDEDFIKRFNIESQAAAGLSHTNIVSVYDVGTENDVHYIVMEYVDGITLKNYLAEKAPLEWNEAIAFATQIASALHNAHRNGVVHRDIKPHNILVTKDDVLKVTDFGIARAVSSYTMKVEDGAMGTAHYCSPEQARGGFTDERSDIYSLGIVMYEMLTGKLPFESDNSISVAIKHMQEDAVNPSEINPSIPKSVEEIVIKAMAKNPNDRFQSASELMIELNFVVQTQNFEREKIENNQKIEEKYANLKKQEKEGKEEINNNHTKGKKKKEKPEKTKEDKVAVIAAVISSFVIVFALSLFAVATFFPNMLPWKKEEVGSLEVPDLIGANYEEVVETYTNIKLVKKEAYSSDYENGVIIEQTPGANEMMEPPFEIVVVVSIGAKEVRIPDVKNLEYKQAQAELDKYDINWKLEYKESTDIPDGIVISTSPSIGNKVNVNSDIVTLIVSSGNVKKEIVVPNVVGKDKDEAELEISKLGLTSSVVEEESSKAKGTVIKQSISAGSTVQEKTNVKLTVSSGKKDEKEEQPEIKENENKTTSKNLTILLPQDKETVVVKVTVDGVTCYEKTHDTEPGTVTVAVSGSGECVVAYYIDGVLKNERKYNFE